jgi:hypothetical protein
MRYEWLLDIKSAYEHLPGRVVETKDSLVFLNVFFSLVGDAVGIRGYYTWSDDIRCKGV